MHDLKAAIAAEIATKFPMKYRVGYVAGTLQIDPDEARELIARGQRIAREKAKEISA
jgi:hypothetical protein